MNLMHRSAAVVLALASFGCGDGGGNAPPIAETDPTTITSASASMSATGADSTSSSGSESSTGLTSCENYLGCVSSKCQPHETACEQGCADDAGVDGQACTDEYCEELFSQCSIDNPGPCTEYDKRCSNGETSSSSSSTSSDSGESSSSDSGPGPCDGYFNCLDKCDGDPDLCADCPVFLNGATQEECDGMRCDALFDDCNNNGVPGACLDYLEQCTGGESSSSGESGSSSSSGGA